MKSALSARTSRRRFLRGAGISAAAAATIGAVGLPLESAMRAAFAQQAAPTAPEFAAFTESAELAAVAFYGMVRAHVAQPAAVAAVTAYARHHQDHANALAPLGGDKRTGKPNGPLLQALADRLTRAAAESDVLGIVYDLEGSMASTHLFVIGSIDDAALLKVAASALPIEAEHAVVLGGILGKPVKDMTAPDKDQVGYESEDRHLDPATFPTSATTTTTVAGQK